MVTASPTFVAVLPDKKGLRGEGIKHSSEIPKAPPVDIFDSIQAAAERRYETDAHVLLYGPSEPSTKFVRCNKSSLPSLRENGVDLQILRIFIEWDTGKGEAHVPWTLELWRGFEEKLAVAERDPVLGLILAQCAVWYTTRKGCRWWFELAQPIAVDYGEPIIRGLVSLFRAAGLDVDNSSTVQTWTQPFRLPYVMRDGEPTGSEWPGAFEAHYERRLSLESIPRVGEVEVVTGGVLDQDQPSPEEADALLWDRSGKSPKMTAWMRSVKARLAGREYAGHIFDYEMIPDEGVGAQTDARHERLSSWTASVATLLANEEGTTAQHIYALFLPAVLQLDDDEGRRDWPRELWRMVIWAWGKEQKNIQVKKEEEKQLEAQAVEASETITTGVKNWPSKPKLPSEPGKSFDWIKRRMIVLHGDQHYILSKTGLYSELPVGTRGLVSQIKHMGMDAFIDLTVETRDGIRPATYAELTYDRMVVADSDVYGEPEIEGAYLRHPERVNPVLIVPSFRRRRDLEPTFHPGVDAWIKTFPKWELLERQIAAFLAFELGATAGISIEAMTGAGKKLIAHGFKETLERPALASARDLTERFNARLLRSPFIWLNEGAQLKWGLNHPSDSFRSLSTGDTMAVEQKHRDVVEMTFPMRFIFTANNERLVLQLCEGRDLSPADREAIALRLQHYAAKDAPAKFLRENGGGEFTKGWIAGPRGGSQHIVAKHFLWLYHKYLPTLTLGRNHGLIVEGDLDSPIIRSMQIQGGSTPMVIECLVKLIASYGMSGGQDSALQGLKIKDGQLYVTVGAILDYWRRSFAGSSSEKLTVWKVKSALRGLIVSKQKRSIEGQEERWNEIDVLLIAAEAERNGWMNPQLTALVAARGVVVGTNGNGANGSHATQVGAGIGA